MQALVDAGVDVDKQDRNQWGALMWAMTNRHKGIAKILLDNGASAEAKTSSGRTAFDFIPSDSEMSFYLQDNGYNIGTIGNAGVTDDFYNPGLSQDRFEEELAESDLRRRMMMDSARDLEVDLGNVGIDDQPEVSRHLLHPRNILALTYGLSLSMNSKRYKNSTGAAVCTTRCSYSRKASLTGYWTPSSPTCGRRDPHPRSPFRQI